MKKALASFFLILSTITLFGQNKPTKTELLAHLKEIKKDLQQRITDINNDFQFKNFLAWDDTVVSSFIYDVSIKRCDIDFVKQAIQNDTEAYFNAISLEMISWKDLRSITSKEML